MHKSGKCLPWKLCSWTLLAIKRLVPVYGCHLNSHPTAREAARREQFKHWAVPAATWLGGVLPRGPSFSVVLCSVGLSTGASQNEKKCWRTQSNIWKYKWGKKSWCWRSLTLNRRDAATAWLERAGRRRSRQPGGSYPSPLSWVVGLIQAKRWALVWQSRPLN